MSWNKYFIIVKEVENQKLEEIIKSIKYFKLEFLKKTDFRNASHNRSSDEIALGIVNKGLWVISPNHVAEFFENEPSQLEIDLSSKFNNTIILAIEENGTVGSFGLNLIVNGKRRRVISGSDGEYYFNFGERLGIEEESYSQFKDRLDEDEKEEIREDEGEGGLENYIKFQSLWGVPFSLLQKEMGKSIDDIYNENPEFSIYKFT